MLYKAKSKVEGMGLFSDTYIKNGEYIGTFKTVPAVYTTKFSILKKDEWRRAVCILKFANHSNRPNAKIDEDLNMYAIKNIRANTEICWSYGEDWK